MQEARRHAAKLEKLVFDVSTTTYRRKWAPPRSAKTSLRSNGHPPRNLFVLLNYLASTDLSIWYVHQTLGICNELVKSFLPLFSFSYFVQSWGKWSVYSWREWSTTVALEFYRVFIFWCLTTTFFYCFARLFCLSRCEEGESAHIERTGKEGHPDW